MEALIDILSILSGKTSNEIAERLLDEGIHSLKDFISRVETLSLEL
jgi:hypothetical protein